VWFVVALGLALLGGAGFDWANKRFPHPALAAIALAILFVDLYYWNSANNKLAYARDSYETLYGAGEQRFQQLVAATQPPLTRFHAPSGLTASAP
jgi:4-amino-4-deoxy-L-arabinose transferase-like glycosyltransferase